MQDISFLFSHGKKHTSAQHAAETLENIEREPLSERAVSVISLDALLSTARRIGPAGGLVTGCTSDWRRVKPGDAFVAVLKESQDGHDFVRRAVARGAVAVICERQTPIFDVPQYLVPDSRVALGALCHEVAGSPSERLRVIGVTGTHGKSTTLSILESIFAAAGIEVGVLSSHRTYDGMSLGPGISSSPTPEALAARLARMEAADLSIALVELSSKGLSLQRYAGVQLDAVCITHATSACLDHHHTTENHRIALRRALELLDADGTAVINVDDPVSCQWLAELSGPVLTYACENEAPITAQVVSLNACETVFLLSVDNQTAAVRTSLVGEHLVADCLAAAATALAYQIDLQTIAKGIETLKRVPGQMERVDCGQRFPLFLDSAVTAEGLRAALRTARKLATGRVICVLDDNPPAASTEALAVRSVIERMADVAIVTERRMQRDRAWTEMTSDNFSVQSAADRRRAIAQAIDIAEPDDIVVVTGKRQGTATAQAHAAPPVSDVELVQRAWFAMAAPTLRLVA